MESELIESIFKTMFIPSLEDLALITYAIKIWEGYLEPSVINYKERNWRESTKSIVLKRAENNSLPNTIKEKIFSVIHFVGDNFLDWLRTIYSYSGTTVLETHLKLTNTNPVKFIKWTKYGTIDETKTWEALAKPMMPEGKDVWTYFDKSCELCNETLIQKFWSQMSEDDQKYHSSHFDRHYYYDYLKKYWATKLVGYSDLYFNEILQKHWGHMCKYLKPFLYGNQFKNLNEIMLVLSVVNKDYYAVGYFVNKLNVNDLSFNVVEMTKTLAREMFSNDCLYHKEKDKNIKIIWLFLSHLSNNEVLDVLKDCSSYILRVFYLHPLVRIFFHDIWSIARQFITSVNYLQVLTKVLSQIKKGRATMSLFKGLWMRTSLDLKKSALGLLIGEENQHHIYQCQVRFCKAVTLEALEVIFNDDELKNFKPGINLTSQLLIENEKVDILDYWLKITSSDFLEFKRKFFKTRGMTVFDCFLLKNDADKINLFFEWILKSCCEEEDKNKFKQIVIKNMASDFCHVCLKNDKLKELERFLNHFKSGSKDFVLAEKKIKTWIKVLELVFPSKISDFDGVCQFKRNVMKKLGNKLVYKNWQDVKLFLEWGITKTIPKVEIIAFKDSIVDMLGSKFFRYVIDKEDFKGLDEIMSWFFCDDKNYKWKYYDYKMTMVEKCGFRTLPVNADESCGYDDQEDNYFTYKYDFFIWFFKDSKDIPRWNTFKESIIEGDDYCVDMCCHMIGRNEPDVYRLFLYWGFSHLFWKSNFQKKLNVFKKRVMEGLAKRYISASWQSTVKEFLGWGIYKEEEMQNLKRIIYSKPFVKKCRNELWEILSDWNFVLDKRLVLNKDEGNVLMDEENGEGSKSSDLWGWGDEIEDEEGSENEGEEESEDEEGSENEDEEESEIEDEEESENEDEGESENEAEEESENEDEVEEESENEDEDEEESENDDEDEEVSEDNDNNSDDNDDDEDDDE